MTFSVEIALTGLGVVEIEAEELRSRQPRGARFLLLKAPDHFPLLSFYLDDLKEPGNEGFDVRVGADGSYLVDESLVEKNVTIELSSPNRGFEAEWAETDTATEPGLGASHVALDWLPSASRELGIDDLVASNGRAMSALYSSIVTLPPGRLESRHLLFNPNGELARWIFNGGPPRVLADKLIWTQDQVSSLTVSAGNRRFVFDAALRVQRGEDPRIFLAITNVPKRGYSGRYNSPGHFGHYSVLSRSERKVLLPLREGGDASADTGYAACPPTYRKA